MDNQPAGWCVIAPREHYPRLERGRILRRVDAAPVWSVTCFFVAKPFRRQRISGQLLRAAMRYAGKQGATIIEGYPVTPKTDHIPDAFA